MNFIKKILLILIGVFMILLVFSWIKIYIVPQILEILQ